jgi:hypothetical protein
MVVQAPKFRLIYWSKRSTRLRNEHRTGYLIPLSQDITLNPGGVVLEVGSYAYIENEPILSQGAAITIVP